MLEAAGFVRGEVLEDLVRPVAVQRGVEKSGWLHDFAVLDFLQRVVRHGAE